MELFGNYTALITPFTASKNIDYKSLENLVKFQIFHNTNGIVALGSTAEAPTLNNFEKHKIMETIINSSKKEIPIIAGINAFSLNDALLQSHQRFIDGADALLVSPPPYIKPTEKGILYFFNTIADNSYIPIIIYNIPSRTGTSLSIKTITELCCHPNIIGLKEASGDMILSTKIAYETNNQSFNILSGNDNLLLPMLSIGAKGIISVVGNVLPEICNKTISLFNSDNQTKANMFYNKYFQLIEALSLESNPIPIKYLMSKLNLIKPYYRAPLCLPSKKTKNKINQTLSLLDLNKM